MADEDLVTQRPHGLHGELLPTAYVLPQGLTYDEWAEDGPPLIQMARSSMFWLGDWLRYGEHNFGEKYVQASDVTGLAIQTLKNAQWVADRIPPDERRPDVPFSHHKAVAVLDPAPRRALLDRAAEEHMTEYHLREKVKEAKEASALPGETVIPPIDVDPPPPSLLALLDVAVEELDEALANGSWDPVKRARDVILDARRACEEETTDG